MVIVSGTSYRYTLFDDISDSNPCTLSVTSSPQTFSYNPKPLHWRIGKADDWGRWGNTAMPRQLLMAPDAGTFFNPTYAVASGNISLPMAVQDATVGVTLYQNSFGLLNGNIQTASVAMGSVNVLVTAGNTVNWQIIRGAMTDFSGGPGFTTQIQLSVSVQLVYTTTSTPIAQMSQFEFQT